MPIYEFHCSSCDENFEELVFRASEIEELRCPACKSKKIEQLLSAFSSGSSKGDSSSSASSSCGSGGFS